jgi:3-phenylpropionate/cinnamic acid dioxygenase small subunit
MSEASSIRKVVKFIVPLLLTLILLPSFVYSFSFVSSLPSSYVIKVVPLNENYNPTKAIVVVEALYPEGFKVVAQKLTNGEPVLAYVDVQNLTNAWNNEEELSHCKALPTFSIVVLTEDRLEDRIFSIQWNELKPFAVKEVYILPKIKREKKVSLGEVSKENNLIVLAKKEEGKKESYYMQYSYLDKVYEENIRVNIMKGTTDSSSQIVLLAHYKSGALLTLSIDTYWTSIGSWNIGGYFGKSSNKDSGWITSGIGYSSTGYISMVATHRIEHWVYLNPDGTKHDEEYKAYWASFDPSTMNNSKGEDSVSVNYNLITTALGKGVEASNIMYTDGTSSRSSFTVSVPVGKFIQDAATVFQFPPLVLVTLIFSVDVKYSDTTAMDLVAEFWGANGYYYDIFRGTSKWGSIPAAYYQVARHIP